MVYDTEDDESKTSTHRQPPSCILAEMRAKINIFCSHLPLSSYDLFPNTEQQFIQDLALFFCSYLKEHGELVEKSEMNETLLKSLHYLILISEVEEVEIFKICLEYWNSLASDLYRESPYATGAAPLFMSRPTASNNR